MNEQILSPIAESMIYAYLDAQSYSRSFKEDHGDPPPGMGKVMHMRGVVQAAMRRDDRYELSAAYIDHGRVEVKDVSDGSVYLLRSAKSVKVDKEMRQRQQTETLFNVPQFIATPTKLLIYRFRQEGLDFSLAGTKQMHGRKRLEICDAPAFVATWPYHSPGDTSGPFDQGRENSSAFEELGDVDLDVWGREG